MSKTGKTAEQMGAMQRDISVSEFFTKNRHLLGFDNPRKALLTCVKEAVDNSLDACEEAGILPDLIVHIQPLGEHGEEDPDKVPSPAQATRFRVRIRDNGPGIVKEQIPKIFARLLYGSKFHRLRMSRGQQGIGISAAGMYGQLTTGQAVRVTSRTGRRAHANTMFIQIDTKKNRPIIVSKDAGDWEMERGTEVSIELEGKYMKGRSSVDEYLEQTMIANPHVQLLYIAPDGEEVLFPRGHHELPHPPKEISPHPYGIELGTLMKMMQDTKARYVSSFLTEDFSRVSAKVAKEICDRAGISHKAKPRTAVSQGQSLYKAIQKTKLMAPPTDCLSPIGERAILSGLYKQIQGEFYTAVTRPPAVYRGNPFIIEAGVAYGKLPSKDDRKGSEGPKAEGEDKRGGGELARLIRYANRVPLLYQQSACAVFKSVVDMNWKNYGIGQSRGALPQGPMVVFVHMASVWVPFTSESKEAIADYDEIRKEIRLAVQECCRRLAVYVKRKSQAKAHLKKRNMFDMYIEEIAQACNRIKDGKVNIESLKEQLHAVAYSKTGGEKTDEITNVEERGPFGLPHSIFIDDDGETACSDEEAAKVVKSVEAGAEAVVELKEGEDQDENAEEGDA